MSLSVDINYWDLWENINSLKIIIIKMTYHFTKESQLYFSILWN